MGEAAIKIRDHFTGAEPTTLTPGSGSWYPLTAIGEPGSVGLPPITPTLYAGHAKDYRTRAVRVRSGQLATSALETVGRVRGARVEWIGLTKANRDTLREWLDGTVRGVAAFQIEPDGPGTGAKNVRMVGKVQDENVGKGAWNVAVDVEEVLV